MEPLTGLAISQAVQGVTRSLDSSSDSTEQSGGSGFDAELRSLLPASAGSEINEEELFAALLEKRIRDLKGDEAGNAFREEFESEKSAHTRADGYVWLEDAANAALGEMVAQGHLSEGEKSEVYDAAFQAAQLDDNKSALYDGRGDTVAVSDTEAALRSAEEMIAALLTGQITSESSVDDSESGGSGATDGSSDSSSTTDTGVTDPSGPVDPSDPTTSGDVTVKIPSGNTFDGGEGFLWKPESESSGNLVVLMPQNLAQQVSSLVIRDENDNEVARGQSTGYANGGREHFRFPKPGDDYPSNVKAVVTLNSGEVIEYKIPNPGERYD